MNTVFLASVNLNFYWGNAGYSYAFNGKEKDDEITGNSGDSYDFGARMYDGRLGRWLTIDPISFKYPAHSGYNFAINCPILFYDPSGEVIKIADPNDPKKEPIIYKPGDQAPEGASTFVKEVYASLNTVYSSGGPVAVGIIDGVVNDPDYEVTIVETKDFGAGETGYNPETGTISYNPYEGMVVTDEGVDAKQSPAIGLLHELDHADQDRKLMNAVRDAKKNGTKTDVKAAKKALREYYKDSDGAEEARATANESVVAKVMGQGTRETYDHVKKIFKTISSTSTEQSTDVSKKEQKQIDDTNKDLEEGPANKPVEQPAPQN